MKRRIIVLVLLALVNTGVTAQAKRRDWVIRINTGTFLSITNASIEKAFGKRHSASLLPSYSYFRSRQFKYETYGIGTEYRYYFMGKSMAPKGFYGAAGVSFDNGKATVETNNNEVTDVRGFTTQFLGGKQWILKQGLTLDINLGIQYVKLDFKNDRYTGGYNGWLPGLGAGIGYAF